MFVLFLCTFDTRTMKLIEVKGKKINKLKVFSDGVTYDFYSDEDEAKTIDFIIDNYIKESGLYGLQAALKFKEHVRENGGIDVNCVSIRNSYLKIEASSTGKSLTGKIGKYAYFKEPKSNESTKTNVNQVAEVFVKMVDAQLAFYNKTCVKGFELTMEDVIKHLKLSILKK